MSKPLYPSFNPLKPDSLKKDPTHFAVNELFVRSPILSDLMKKVEQLTKLNLLVLEKLDPSLARHCRVLSCEDGTLVLSTSSPAWGHTLRFNEMNILSDLRGHPEWCGLKSIRTRVYPPHEIESHEVQANPHTSSKFPKPTLTKTGSDALHAIANRVESHRLQDALLRLAKRFS